MPKQIGFNPNRKEIVMAKRMKWTEDATAYVVNRYAEVENDNSQLEAIAAEITEKFGGEAVVSKKAVIGKLVSEGVYARSEAAPKETVKDEGPTKKELQAQLADLGVDVDGSDGATKGFLSTVISALSDRNEAEVSAEV